MESFILLNNNEIERKYVFCIEIYYLLTCLYYNKLVLNSCEEININCHYVKCDIKPIERPVQQSNQPNQSITNGNSNPKFTCSHCGKGHRNEKCWRKFPHKAPPHLRKKFEKTRILDRILSPLYPR